MKSTFDFSIFESCPQCSSILIGDRLWCCTEKAKSGGRSWHKMSMLLKVGFVDYTKNGENVFHSIKMNLG